MPCPNHGSSTKPDRVVIDLRPGHRPALYCGATTDHKTTCTKRVYGVDIRGLRYKENPVTQSILDSLGVDDKPDSHGNYPTSLSPFAMYEYELETFDTEGDSN